jgi:hypothetical protein
MWFIQGAFQFFNSQKCGKSLPTSAHNEIAFRVPDSRKPGNALFHVASHALPIQTSFDFSGGFDRLLQNQPLCCKQSEHFRSSIFVRDNRGLL